jgi:hypothetical protein
LEIFNPKKLWIKVLLLKNPFSSCRCGDVWDALVNPKKIKHILFGTTLFSDWKVGSRITYKGVWQGKEYEDGGTICNWYQEKSFNPLTEFDGRH